MNSRVGSREYDRFTDTMVAIISVAVALVPWFIVVVEVTLS